MTFFNDIKCFLNDIQMVLETLPPLLCVINKDKTKITYFTANGQREGLFVAGKRQLMRIRFAFLP